MNDEKLSQHDQVESSVQQGGDTPVAYEISTYCPVCRGPKVGVMKSTVSELKCPTCSGSLAVIKPLLGIVYVVSNPRMPGLLKIGCTTRTVEERLSELNRSTSAPAPLFLRANPAQGTIGTEMTVFGSGFGTGKGKVFVGEAPLKVLEWKDDSIRCLLTKAIPPDIYNVTIQPRDKGSTPITIDHGFTVKRPEIGPLDPPGGSAGDQITIHGFFFGTKKGKVTLGGKNCKVLSWTMDSTTGESSIRMVVPKGLSAGVNELKVTNGVGTGTASFTVE